MKTLLLILILFGDPSHEKLANGIAEDLRRVGGDQVQVVVGADAAAELEQRGVKVQDLVASPNIADTLTASDANLALVDLSADVHGGDVVVETRLWIGGKSDRHVAIAGNGGDPQAAVSNGLITALADRLPNAHGVALSADENSLAALAKAKEWQRILGVLAGVKERSPRQWYYEVLAFSRLGRRDAAVEALNAMRAAFPDHVLLKAATDVVPPEAAAPAVPAAEDPLDAQPVHAGDDRGDTLR